MKIAMVLSRIPWPLEKGDKLRAYHQARCLAKEHEVHLYCLHSETPSPKAKEALEAICASVTFIRLSPIKRLIRMAFALGSSRPFQVHYFYQRAAARMLKKHLNERVPDHIYCQLIRCTEYVKDLHHIPKTLDYMDAFNKGMERLAQQGPWYYRPFWRTESRRLVRYENLIFDYFDRHCIISRQDRDLIYHPKRKKIAVVPNGVDTAFFTPSDRIPSYEVVFTGNMNYPPNIDTAEILAKEVMPIVRETIPGARLLLAGASPHPRVSALISQHVEVSGWVEDIRQSYAAGKVFAAPLRIGTGLQNKLLEAMSMGLPCVTTHLANNALGAEPGREILLGDSASDHAKAIVGLLESKPLAKELAERGRHFVLLHYSWEGASEILVQLMRSVTRNTSNIG